MITITYMWLDGILQARLHFFILRRRQLLGVPSLLNTSTPRKTVNPGAAFHPLCRLPSWMTPPPRT
jgi:hypothetical protein